jgi:hypothetical protein
MSVRASTGSPESCSGEPYGGVAMTGAGSLPPTRVVIPTSSNLDADRREHHVGGFDVPLNDAAAMRLVQCINNLCAVLDSFCRGQRAARQTVLQRLAFEIPHDDGVDAVRAADVVNGADVRMIQVRDVLRFACELVASPLTATPGVAGKVESMRF